MEVYFDDAQACQQAGCLCLNSPWLLMDASVTGARLLKNCLDLSCRNAENRRDVKLSQLGMK